MLIILVIVGTVVLVLKKINDLKVKYKIDEPVATVFERDEKVEDPDKIYVAHEGETFDLNDIVITEYYYSSDGTISFNYPNGNFASFIQISGLINKEIENNINAKLKEIPINFFNEHPGCNVTTYATASYSNVLSLYSSFYDRTTNEFGYVKGYTIDLNTGNDITLEDVFTKSAPIYSILYNAFLKGRVWVDYEAIERPYYDAQDTDLSNSEDFVYTLKSTYDNHKDDIDFYVDEGKITILNIDENGNYVSDCTKSIDNIDVNIYDVKEYFTLYKKYLGNNLYDNDNYIDQIDVFAESSVFGPLYDYGKKDEVIRMNNENLVVNVGFAFGLNNLDVDIKNSTKNHINNVLNDLINNLVKDDGYVYFFVGSVSGPTHWNAGMNGIYINNTYTSRYTREFYDSRLELTIYKIEKDFWNNNKYKYNALIAQAPKMAMTPYPVSLRLNQNDELFNHFEYINLIEGRNGTYNFDKYYYYDANKNYIGDDGSVVLVEPQYGYGQS